VVIEADEAVPDVENEGLTFEDIRVSSASTSVFPKGPRLTQTKLGALATLAGGAMAIAAARALRAGWLA